MSYTLPELISFGLFKFSFNDMKCEPPTAFPSTWEEFEDRCPNFTWEQMECDAVSSISYEELECSERKNLMSWAYYVCENAIQRNDVKTPIYYPDTMTFTDDCA